MINLLISAGVIYLLVVYVAHFAFGFVGEPDEIDELDIWLWLVLLILVFIFITGEKIAPVAQRLATRLKPITGPIARFLRKSIFYLSLPFRPVTLGRFVRNSFTTPNKSLTIHYQP